MTHTPAAAEPLTAKQVSWQAACILAAAEDRRAGGKQFEADELFRIGNAYDDLVRDKSLWAEQSTANAKRMLEAEAALLAARADAERLNWLNGRLNWFTTHGGAFDPAHKNIREAIDAARAALAATPEGE